MNEIEEKTIPEASDASVANHTTTEMQKLSKKRAISMIEDDLRAAQEQVKALELERTRAAVEPIINEIITGLRDSDKVAACLIGLATSDIRKLSDRLVDLIITAADDIRDRRIRDNERRRNKRKGT